MEGGWELGKSGGAIRGSAYLVVVLHALDQPVGGSSARPLAGNAEDGGRDHVVVQSLASALSEQAGMVLPQSLGDLLCHVRLVSVREPRDQAGVEELGRRRLLGQECGTGLGQEWIHVSLEDDIPRPGVRSVIWATSFSRNSLTVLIMMWTCSSAMSFQGADCSLNNLKGAAPGQSRGSRLPGTPRSQLPSPT